MKRFYRYLLGRWRMLLGVCPACGSEPPQVYDCPVCRAWMEGGHDSYGYPPVMWPERFREWLDREGHS